MQLLNKANPCKRISAVCPMGIGSEDPSCCSSSVVAPGPNCWKISLNTAAKPWRTSRNKPKPQAKPRARRRPLPATASGRAGTIMWWRYNRSLDGDLVVITPALMATPASMPPGNCRWRRNRDFQMHGTFLSHVRSHGQAFTASHVAGHGRGPLVEVSAPPWLSAEKQSLTTLILHSYERSFGRFIAAAHQLDAEQVQCQELFACGFPVLAHGMEMDPRLSYANAAALQLWETNWNELIGLPSRLTAPTSERSDRQSALTQALAIQAISGYSGIRISRRERRFMINNARVWSIRDNHEQMLGQAASFSDWWWV